MTQRPVLFAGAAAVWCVAMTIAPSLDAVASRGRTVSPLATPVASSFTQDAAIAAPARVSFERDVMPIIELNCLDCHSPDARKGGLSLGTYGDLLDGGKDGPIVRPGNSAASMLIHRLNGDRVDQMPKDAAPLSQDEIAVITRWIDEGARPAPDAAPAPPPWEAPLALSAPAVPEVVWAGWTSPVDRIVAAYLHERGAQEPELVSDVRFARRAYLDLWGLLPTPDDIHAISRAGSLDRPALVARLLADDSRYAEHWISFWNDLLRNEDGVNYYSETDGRRSISPWLLRALFSNLPYDQFVSALLNPTSSDDPEGFVIGVNWRGETSAAVTPWMQASQNTAQVFLGVNLKCNACHDSFVNRWKLKDAYGLASYFSPDARLQLFRCDIAQDSYAEPAFLYPELNRTPPSSALADRRATIAAIITDPRNGRFARTVVNRLWQRLVGFGIVDNPDEMDGRPWSPELLDWLASDFVAHGYDLKHLIATIVASRAYQMPAVARQAEPAARDYVFAGPEVRRMTAEQWSDAVGAITGEWSVSTLAVARLTPEPRPSGGRGTGASASPGQARGGPVPSDPTTAGTYVREWRAASSNLTRALGRPIRDQVISVRATQPTTPQALELVNGEILTRRLMFGARRMTGQLAPEPPALYTRAVAGRSARPSTFDIDVTGVERLWLLVQENGSNEPARVQPIWAGAELVNAQGVSTPLSSLTPEDTTGLRAGDGPVLVGDSSMAALRVTNPSTLIYDITGRGFTRLRGSMWIENPISDIGATLDPQIRFFVFGTEPNMERLIPAGSDVPLPAPPASTSIAETVDRVFLHALGRTPTDAERRLAEEALRDPASSARPSAEGLADLLWALFVKPEFQLIY